MGPPLLSIFINILTDEIYLAMLWTTIYLLETVCKEEEPGALVKLIFVVDKADSIEIFAVLIRISHKELNIRVLFVDKLDKLINVAFKLLNASRVVGLESAGNFLDVFSDPVVN